MALSVETRVAFPVATCKQFKRTTCPATHATLHATVAINGVTAHASLGESLCMGVTAGRSMSWCLRALPRASHLTRGTVIKSSRQTTCDVELRHSRSRRCSHVRGWACGIGALPAPWALADFVGSLQVQRHACYAVSEAQKALSQALIQNFTSTKQVLSIIICYQQLQCSYPTEALTMQTDQKLNCTQGTASHRLQVSYCALSYKA